MITDNYIANLSALDVLSNRNINAGGDTLVIQSIMLDYMFATTPISNLLRIFCRHNSRFAAHLRELKFSIDSESLRGLQLSSAVQIALHVRRPLALQVVLLDLDVQGVEVCFPA